MLRIYGKRYIALSERFYVLEKTKIMERTVPLHVREVDP